MARATRTDDTLPCRTGFSASSIKAAKRILDDLPHTCPGLLAEAGITPDEWPPLLRAAVESMRGTNSADGRDKRRFVDAILQHCQQLSLIKYWSFTGDNTRHDYRVALSDGTQVALEAKGCPDGNNTNIWDRPQWADEFVVWSLCPDSLAHNPGKGVWSGISIRLLPKVAAERTVVNAFIFWDARCGTKLRNCPKGFGVSGPLRPQATDIESQDGKPQWVPPPCIYLLPKNAPTVSHNLKPAVHTIGTSRFAAMLLQALNVPDGQIRDHVHTAEVEARGSAQGTEIQIATTSRCWPDNKERIHTSDWKPLKREA